MKHTMFTVAALCFFSAVALCGGHPEPAAGVAGRSFSAEQLDMIEENLVVGLESAVPGVRATAALTLRQVKQIAPEYAFNRSIIPLMRIVGSEELDATSRIAAGLALNDLRSERGDYRIKMAGRFEENPKVKRLYELLSYYRTQENSAR